MAIRKLTDEQWDRVKVHIPKYKPSPKGGRPPADDPACLEEILWIMSTGAQWMELPKRYQGYATCWRRLKAWEQAGVFIKMWRSFLAELNADERIA